MALHLLGIGPGDEVITSAYTYTASASVIHHVGAKIVLVDTGLGRWMYQDLIKNGAVGAMTFDGHYAYADNDIDQKELRGLTSDDKVIPCVNVNVKSAIEMVRTGTPMVKIILEQDQYKGESHNVIVDIIVKQQSMTKYHTGCI